MSADYLKAETNLRRLLSSTERLAATSARELAIEATAASTFYQGQLQHAVSYKAPFVVTLFKKVRPLTDCMTLTVGLLLLRPNANRLFPAQD